MLFGSYFGDWDIYNSFLKAPLASKGWGLTSCWAGRPYWINHHTALGETVGYSTWVTMRNTSYQSNGPNFNRTSINLMGDPTLRIHPVAPPKNLLVTGTTLNWTASAEPLSGYCIYRKNNVSGVYNKIATVGNNMTTFVDGNPNIGENKYMVRAQKLEISNSGTYFNLSQGAFDFPIVVPLELLNYTVKLNGNTVVNNWETSNEVNVNYINIQRSVDAKNFITISKIKAKGEGLYSYTDANLPLNESTLYYRLQIVDNDAKIKNESVVAIKLSIDNKPTFTVYPNPVTNKNINVFLNQLPKGNYNLTLINSVGKVVKESKLDYDGKKLSFKVDADLISGSYILKLKSENYNDFKKIIVK